MNWKNNRLTRWLGCPLSPAWDKARIGLTAFVIIGMVLLATCPAHATIAGDIQKSEWPTGYPRNTITYGSMDSTWVGRVVTSVSTWWTTGMNNWMNAYQRELIAKRYSY